MASLLSQALKEVEGGCLVEEMEEAEAEEAEEAKVAEEAE
eukprot:CAMPEP_0119325960 /NCGR_PEP_ID=MMETSP1333-20130426/67127_1 /TAXON_ID=418940 /ORGANISM="Scyphosphaera apsteinii, Strain RCC1455" /LENGTH=39 /DNA_ID= /DNA_START= /DNA_END= /DNA_ORIENTATION=